MACAQSSAPITGGAKDITAPRIDSSKTNPINGTLNFTDQRMVLAFDEFVTLNKPLENIIVTPQQTIPPKFSVKNKKVFIDFQEELQANTTYTLSVNGAIQDYTEKNDSVFQYVFSTGDFIDSLHLTGNIINGKTNLPEQGLLVGLYPKQSEVSYDSIIYNLKPTYLAQTNANGMFQFNYLKSGEYSVFAIRDKNRNLLADPGEAIAFMKDEYISAGDSTLIEMKSFLPEDGICKLTETYFKYPGKIIFTGTCPLTDFQVRSSIELIEEKTDREDSLVYWLLTPPTSKMEFITTTYGEIDTIKPFYDGVPEKITLGDLTLTNNLSKGNLLPGANLEITANAAIGEVSEGITFLDKDSNKVDIEYAILEPRVVTFYTLGTNAAIVQIDSAAIKSNYGNYSNKKTNLSFETLDSTYFGNLKVNIDTIFQQPVIVQLLNSNKKVIVEMPFSQTLVFKNLVPGNYNMVLIIDENGDGKWTTGALKEKREPESLIYSTQEMTVKSKWDKEIDWNLKIIKREE